MKLSHFDFELPEELLAEHPAENRDESRLMVLNRKEQTIEHKQFKDLIDYFDEDDVMVLITLKYFLHVYMVTKKKLEQELKCFY